MDVSGITGGPFGQGNPSNDPTWGYNGVFNPTSPGYPKLTGTTYKITCYGRTASGGLDYGNKASDSVTVFSSSITVPTEPTLTLTATPTSINAGQSSTLTWSSNADCTSSNNWVLKVDAIGDDFANGITYSSGTTIVNPTQTTTYSITCKNSAGQSVSKDVLVTVTNQPLALGSWIQLTGNTNVWQNPTTSSIVLTTQVTSAKGRLVQGPIQADGYTWWKVDYETSEDGWSQDLLMKKINSPVLS